MGTALTGWLARWRPPRRVLVAIAVAVLAGLGALLVWIRSGSDPEELSLGAFESLVEEGEVDTAEIADRSHRVTGELADGDAYEVTYPEEYTDELTSLLVDNGVELDTDAESESFWMVLLWQYLPLVLIAGLVIYLVWSFQGGRGSGRFGRARARRPGGDQPEVTFADVAGCDEAVEELLEVKEFLADPDRFRAIGARIPKGILLYGPPGTGKTLLARAVAGEAGAPFFSISGSDFVEMYVGVGASRVRDLFEQAERAAPAIIFVDEIDAVGRHRGAGLGGGHDEREQTLNQLLVEMDGFDVSTGVILIAASNRPDILDPALLRPGRFDRRIVVDRPDLDGRRAILEVHAAGKPFADDVDLSIVARRTSGFTGADLANVLNEAALLSARRGHDRVTRAEIEEAVDRVMAGPERKGKVMSEREKLVSAYHEAGHALAGHLLPNTDPIHKVSIVARGQALGWTQSLPEEERRLLTRSELRDRMAMLLAGRAAEERTFGEPSTGAQDDIRRATDIARAMVTEYGMSALGPQHVTSEPEGDRSEHVAARIDTEVQRLVDDAHREATEILTLHRSTLDSLADALVEHETLDERALEALLGPARGPGSATERPWSHAPEPAEAAGHMTAVDEGTRLQHGDTGGPAH